MAVYNTLRLVAVSACFCAGLSQDVFLAMPPATRPAPDASVWAAFRDLLAGWGLTTEYVVSVGTAEHGNLFTYQGGNFTAHTQIPTGSTSKWPSAMMFVGLVNDGTISSLDDLVSKYLPYWTKDPKDKRSLVTFRMLLSFTSGFGDGHPGEEANTRAAREWRSTNAAPRKPTGLHDRLESEVGVAAASACNSTTGDIADCAKSIYENVKLIGTPGQVYSYNGNHLQLAAGVVVAASGLNIQQVIKKYLLTPFNMTDSFYGGKCPEFAGGLRTTAADYERFLSGLLSYKTLSKKLVDASEEDNTPFLEGYTLYGDYGFGHFLLCFDSVEGMTTACKESKVHMDPGAYGWMPIIDRKYGYYMQVAGAEIAPTGSYPLSGIPEYFAVAIKPVLDKIMSDSPPSAASLKSHFPAFLSMSVADLNYCVNCKIHPENCS